MIAMYGIPNCGSVKKAKVWLDAHGMAFEFHDVKKEGLDEAQLRRWMVQVSWSVLLNKRGLTWRRLDAADRADLNEEKAVSLLLAHPTMLKRPVLVVAEGLLVGFDAVLYADKLLPTDISKE